MAEKEEKVTLEDLQKQVEEITQQVKTLTEENTNLKEQVAQKDLEITKLSLGGVKKQEVTKEQKEDEDVEFDFEF